MKVEAFIHKHFFTLSIILILICGGALFYLCLLDKSVWYDEAYTMFMMTYSFSEILEITARDVHPPLYYIFLKAFLSFFDNSMFNLRVFSLLGVLASFALALFPIRRLFGKSVAFTFILLLSIMPVTQYLGVEIRMYSWAMFFVLACSVYAYDAYQKGTLLPYSLMTFFAICSAYTHNYGVIAVGVIYILLTVMIYKKEKCIYKVIISLVVLLLAYGVWIPVIIEQIQNVQKDYWIEPLTPKDLLLLCYYFFSPKEPSHSYILFSLPVMAAVLAIMLALIGIIIAIVIKKHYPKPSKKFITADLFVAVYVLTVIITLAISFLIKPISVSRYTNCMLGPLLLGASIYITELYKEKYKIVLGLALGLLLILGITRFFSGRAQSLTTNNHIKEIREFLTQEDSPTYLIATPRSYSLLTELSAMFPEKKFAVYSPYKYVNYRPLQFDVIKLIPDSLRFYSVELIALEDSVKIEDNYIKEKELLYPRFNITLLKPDLNNK